MKRTQSRQANENLRDYRTGGGASPTRSTRGSSRGKAAGGVGGLGIIGIIIALLFGGNIFSGGSASGAPSFGGATSSDYAEGSEVVLDSEEEQFVNQLLVDVQGFWVETFDEAGIAYSEATIGLYDTPISTGCGTATKEIGPHYCSLDKGIYLELGFFDLMSSRFGASGDFAQAYVIAHEFGHHVQAELGISGWMREQAARQPSLRNQLSVALELQADCLAGVWARSADERGLLERGDLQEAFDAAAAVGDDNIQAKTSGRINPESWTHGSSAQRQEWFDVGFGTGDTEACDTFAVYFEQ